MSVLRSLLLDLISVKKPVPDAIKTDQRFSHVQKFLEEHNQLLELLGTGKPVVAERGPNGELRIHCKDQ